MEEKEQILKIIIEEGLKYDKYIFMPENRKPYQYFTILSAEKTKTFRGSFGQYKVKIIVEKVATT